ncbi:MAG TPA: winged helix-turn-helix transcriptional regulator [Thermodesulfobacteriota bacterium]
MRHGIPDAQDIKILQILSNEGRKSFRSIGLQINLAPKSIKTRIESLVSSGVIEKFIIIVSPSALGYEKEYLIIVGKRGEKQNVYNNLNLLGDVILEVQSLGGTSVFRLIVREESENKIQFLADALKPALVETTLASGTYKTKKKLSNTDLSVLKCLIQDPRMEVAEISKKLSISSKTVARRLGAMQNNQAIKFSILINPAALRGYILFAISMKIEVSMYQKILRRIYQDFPENFLLHPPAAPQDTISVVFLSKDVFTSDKILETIESYSGVRESQVFLPTKIKLYQEWLMSGIEKKLKHTN